MGTKLRVRKQDALDFIMDFSDAVFNDTGVFTIFDSSETIDTDILRCDENLYSEYVRIGVKEFDNYRLKTNSLFSTYVNDNEIVRSMIGINHEFAHYIQNDFTFRKNDLSVDEQLQLLQDIACLNNNDFYYGNYTITASEIQAEQYGIIQTYTHLCTLYSNLSKKQCENLVLDVVNEKMLTPGVGYFVKRNHPFTSLNDVNDAFDDAYQHALHTKRYYDIRDLEAGDYAKEYLRDHPDVEYNYDFDALAQSKFIAAINIQKQPAYFDWYPCLRKMDLPDVSGKSKDLGWRQREADLLLSNIENPDDNYEKDL